MSPATDERMVPVVAAYCTCDKCTSRTAEMYDLPARCLNCGAAFTVRNRKGDKAPLSVECPHCEVVGYSWRRLS